MNEKPITPTCGNCGKPMKTNVPRLGPAGGWVHSDTGQLECSISAVTPPPEAARETARTTKEPKLHQWCDIEHQDLVNALNRMARSAMEGNEKAYDDCYSGVIDMVDELHSQLSRKAGWEE